MEKRNVTFREVVKAVEQQGYELIDMRDLTKHPDDWYLKVVKAYNRAKKECVIWLYNATDRGLHEGYYTTSFEAANNKYLTK